MFRIFWRSRMRYAYANEFESEASEDSVATGPNYKCSPPGLRDPCRTGPSTGFSAKRLDAVASQSHDDVFGSEFREKLSNLFQRAMMLVEISRPIVGIQERPFVECLLALEIQPRVVEVDGGQSSEDSLGDL